MDSRLQTSGMTPIQTADSRLLTPNQPVIPAFAGIQDPCNRLGPGADCGFPTTVQGADTWVRPYESHLLCCRLFEQFLPRFADPFLDGVFGQAHVIV